MQQLTTVLGVAGIYALLATGIVLVYRTSRVVNLAQGHLAILCAFFVAALLAAGYHWSAALPATIVVGCVLALRIYFVVMRRIVGEPPFVGLMATVGIAILLRGVMVVAFGGVTITTQPLLSGSIRLFGIRFVGNPCAGRGRGVDPVRRDRGDQPVHQYRAVHARYHRQRYSGGAARRQYRPYCVPCLGDRDLRRRRRRVSA